MKAERFLVKVGLGTLNRRMTRDQARRWGEKNMPADLRRAGFSVHLFTADPEINGWAGLRINYGKTVPTSA